MGHQPLKQKAEIVEIRAWLRARGIKKIEDITEWDNKGNWLRWKWPRIPEQLKNQFVVLNDEIVDFTPIHIDEEDTWG